MNNKKKIIVTLLGIITFLGVSMKCEAACQAQSGEVCTGATGGGLTGGSAAGNCGGKGSCWGGIGASSGTQITVTPVEGSDLKGIDIVVTNNKLNELGISSTIKNSNGLYGGDIQHAEDWKREINGLGSVINGKTEPSAAQKWLLELMAEANNKSVDDFKKAYIEQATTSENNDAFNYKDTPKAYVCKEGTNECDWFASQEECMAAGFAQYGCAAARWASESCGKEACTGYDKGLIKEDESCLEKNKDKPNKEYICCVEAYGEEACNYTPQIPSINPNTCDPVEIEPQTVSPRPIPDSKTSGSIGCGNTYVTTTYSTGTTSCQYVKTLITIERTENYPSVATNYMAGDGVNFSNTVNWFSTRTEIFWDDSDLKNERSKAQSIIDKIDNTIKCLDETRRDYAKQLTRVESSKQTCERDYKDKKEEFDNCKKNNLTYCIEPSSCYSYDTTIKQLQQQIQDIDNKIDAYKKSKEYKDANDRLAELEDCGSRASSFQSTTSSSSGTYTLGDSYLSLDKYTQTINSIKGIAKNSGQLLTQNELNSFKFPYFPNSANFVIPIETKNGTNGSVVAVKDGGALYSCPINVRNLFIVDCSKGNCGTGGVNVIYRPISLTNPFPNLTANGKYRAMGANWNEIYAQTVIENNRNVSNYQVYNQTPIYTIELTPSKIKEIRKYNKEVPYNNFDMNCTDGYLCSSNFLWGMTANGYNFSDIVVQSESCATANGWSACYGGGN